MLTKVQEQWVKELQSGKYKQGRKQLKSWQGHCCLGVLCELAKKEGIIEGFEGEDGYLPTEVMGWAGLATSAGDFDEFCNDVRSLTDLNDEGSSFGEIAEFIKSEPKGLFMPAGASQ